MTTNNNTRFRSYPCSCNQRQLRIIRHPDVETRKAYVMMGHFVMGIDQEV